MMWPNRHTQHRQAIVIGSGFGGSMAAWALVQEGRDVLMLERGPAVDRGPQNWEPDGTIMRSPYYLAGPRYSATTDRGAKEVGACSCVGGPSVFYGGVSLRFRETDFDPGPEIVGDSGAQWPFSYADLQPFYAEVERVLNVAGRSGDDPTDPPRSAEYPEPPGALSEVSQRLAEGALSRGLQPFRLPLAISYGARGSSSGCIECATCDTFACAIEAKNDLSIQVLPRLMSRGLELWSEVAVTRLHTEAGRVTGVEYVDTRGGTRHTVTADVVIMAAGALGSAHILLSSGLDQMNPAGDAVGRYLTRHCSSIVFGAYPWMPRFEGRFHKQIGINDYYHGDPSGGGPAGKLGNIQQTQTPTVGTVRGELNRASAFLISPLVRRSTGLLIVAEDRPQWRNRLSLGSSETDELGLPRAQIEHRYHARDLESRAFLEERAKEIHRATRARATYTHRIDTFSHALGTVRMGLDPASSPLDREGRFRGVSNLYVSDGSALPTSAGVNPSLTIAANALRVGRIAAAGLRSGAA